MIFSENRYPAPDRVGERPFRDNALIISMPGDPAISSQGFDAVLFHSSGGIGNELMSIVELNAVRGVGQDLGDETLELQQFFPGRTL
jgi:hypothetical protein